MALSAGDSISNPPQGSPELTAAAGRGRASDGRQPARLAGAEAQGLSPRPELRELGWRSGPQPASATIARSPRRGCRTSCSNISTAVRTTKSRFARNVEDLQSIALRQRVLRDVSTIDLSTELFGKRWAMPVGLGPVGLSGLYARRGEVPGGKGRGRGGRSVHAVDGQRLLARRSRGGGPVPWYQLYFVKDRGFVGEHDRARQGGGLRRIDADGRPGGSGLALSRLRARLAGAVAAGSASCWRGPRWLWDVGIRGPAAQPRQSRADRRQARALDRLPGVDPRQFRPSVSWKTSSGCGRSGTAR